MSYGKMREIIEISAVKSVKDSAGFGEKKDDIKAHVRAYHEARHGTEKWANRAAFTQATDLFRFRKIPGLDITAKHVIICRGVRYNITSVEDVKGRGMYIEVLAERVENSSG